MIVTDDDGTHQVPFAESDVEIGGHLIPSGTACLFSNEILGRDLRFFGPDPESFVPERWLEESRKRPHPFSVRPFGFGRRLCLGKRFAELEMQLAVIRTLRSFRVDWAGPGPDEVKVETKTGLVNAPSITLKFKFTPLEQND